ncbi:MFS transporter [Halolamina litorea]|uniref:Major Facilitator Superfamily protein n=1 Tax=Halolamina litorea TaxID=1515593 RepID=A0ABD6BUD8_9EURY|nr:hypothetical protein [Halolamina litorea]
MFDALLYGEVETDTRWPSSLSDFAGMEPGMLVLSVSTLAFSLSIDVISWFIPEYMNRTGAGFGIIGLYASVALLVETAYPYLYPKFRNLSSKRATLAIASVASKGTVLWVLAGEFGFFVPVPPWVLITVGTILVMTWQTHGPGALYDEIRIQSQVDEAHAGGSLTGVEAMKRTGSFLLLFPATFVLVFVGNFEASVQVMAAFIAGIGFFAAASLMVLHDSTEFPDLSVTRPPFEAVRSSLGALTDDLRSALYGDSLVHFSEAMIHVFLIIVIAQYHGIGIDIGPFSLPPEAFFGILVATELIVGLGSVLFGHAVADRLGNRRVVMIGGLAAAGFPIMLVLIPSNAVLIGLLFGFFGLRFAGVPARRALFRERIESDVVPNVDHDLDTVVQSTHLARDAAAVPGGIVAGLLYGLPKDIVMGLGGPSIAFFVAGATALVGLRQFIVFVGE